MQRDNWGLSTQYAWGWKKPRGQIFFYQGWMCEKNNQPTAFHRPLNHKGAKKAQTSGNLPLWLVQRKDSKVLSGFHQNQLNQLCSHITSAWCRQHSQLPQRASIVSKQFQNHIDRLLLLLFWNEVNGLVWKLEKSKSLSCAWEHCLQRHGWRNRVHNGLMQMKLWLPNQWLPCLAMPRQSTNGCLSPEPVGRQVLTKTDHWHEMTMTMIDTNNLENKYINILSVWEIIVKTCDVTHTHMNDR